MSRTDLPPVEINPLGPAPELIEDIRNYWAGKCAGGLLPARDRILPSEIKNWLPRILLADVIDGGADFRYRLVGSSIAHDFATPPTGRLMSEALEPFGEESMRETIRTYRSVVENKTPLQIRGAGDWYAQRAKTFDAILMPLADDGVNVNMIFGAFVFVWNLDRQNEASEPSSAIAAR